MSVLDIKQKIVRVHGEPVTITNETIKRACQWYADNALGCINEAESGQVFVNDLERYRKDKLQEYQRYVGGDFEVGLWFWQRALYIQTGCSVPMLSK